MHRPTPVDHGFQPDRFCVGHPRGPMAAPGDAFETDSASVNVGAVLQGINHPGEHTLGPRFYLDGRFTGAWHVQRQIGQSGFQVSGPILVHHKLLVAVQTTDDQHHRWLDHAGGPLQITNDFFAFKWDADDFDGRAGQPGISPESFGGQRMGTAFFRRILGRPGTKSVIAPSRHVGFSCQGG